jgi:hypothetical protein
MWRSLPATRSSPFRFPEPDILSSVRLVLFLAAAILAGCAPAPAPVEKPKPDPTTEAWYGQDADQLTALSREAETFLQKGDADRAAAIITQAQPLMNRLLSVARPTLAAMEAASDLDQLYGRMLLSNRNYGWARLLFQKNLARWKNWKPQTPDTVRRRKLAESGIAECDRRLAQ